MVTGEENFIFKLLFITLLHTYRIRHVSALSYEDSFLSSAQEYVRKFVV
jgi:hypothetical protein